MIACESGPDIYGISDEQWQVVEEDMLMEPEVIQSFSRGKIMLEYYDLFNIILFRS